MDWAFVHRTWDKWASTNIGHSDHPLKAALLINFDPTGPSRLLSTIAEQEGIKAHPIELSQFVDFVKNNKLQTETFMIGSNQYLVTSIHENWFSARCINTSKPAGEGAIVMQTAAYILVAMYDGSIGPASRAMAAADQFTWQLGRKKSLEWSFFQTVGRTCIYIFLVFCSPVFVQILWLMMELLQNHVGCRLVAYASQVKSNHCV